MLLFVVKITFEVCVGLFILAMWNVDIESIGFLRWLVGWVVTVTLLADVWPLVQKRIST